MLGGTSHVATCELAQTYPQLINQAQSLSMDLNQLQLLKQAFELAVTFSDGLYRAQGVPLINHLIRTASILMVEKQPLVVVLVGLLHAAPILHKFDRSHRSAGLQQKKQALEKHLNADIAALVMQYELLPWYSMQSLQMHRSTIDQASEVTRQLITVRLANELEDNLDGAMLFSNKQRQTLRLGDYLSNCIALAKQLQLTFVALRLEEVKHYSEQASVAEKLQRDYRQGYEMPAKRLWRRSLAEELKYQMMRLLRN